MKTIVNLDEPFENEWIVEVVDKNNEMLFAVYCETEENAKDEIRVALQNYDIYNTDNDIVLTVCTKQIIDWQSL